MEVTGGAQEATIRMVSQKRNGSRSRPSGQEGCSNCAGADGNLLCPTCVEELNEEAYERKYTEGFNDGYDAAQAGTDI